MRRGFLQVEGMHGCFVTETSFVLNTYVTWPYFRLYAYPIIIHSQFFGYQVRCRGRAASVVLPLGCVPDARAWRSRSASGGCVFVRAWPCRI